jgi:hypothetical protein
MTSGALWPIFVQKTDADGRGRPPRAHPMPKYQTKNHKKQEKADDRLLRHVPLHSLLDSVNGSTDNDDDVQVIKEVFVALNVCFILLSGGANF